MGLRFRKSVKICKGLKLNFGKTGISATVGSGAFKKTFHTNGNVTTTVGLPGTGIYWTETERRNSKSNDPVAHARQSGYWQDNADALRASEDLFTEKSDADELSTPAKYLSLADINRIYAYCDESVEWTELIAGETADDLLMDQEKYVYCVGAAPQILAGNVDAYLEAIETLRPVDDLALYGGDFEFGTDDPGTMEVEFCAKPQNVLRDRTDGSLLEQFICAVSIRVARDLFALLPVKTVLVHTVIDGATLLSVLFERNRMDRINYRSGKASDIVKKFEHLCVEDYETLRDVGRLKR